MYVYIPGATEHAEIAMTIALSQLCTYQALLDENLFSSEGARTFRSTLVRKNVLSFTVYFQQILCVETSIFHLFEMDTTHTVCVVPIFDLREIARAAFGLYAREIDRSHPRTTSSAVFLCHTCAIHPSPRS